MRERLHSADMPAGRHQTRGPEALPFRAQHRVGNRLRISQRKRDGESSAANEDDRNKRQDFSISPQAGHARSPH